MKQIKIKAWDTIREMWCSSDDLNLFSECNVVDVEKVRSGIEFCL